MLTCNATYFWAIWVMLQMKNVYIIELVEENNTNKKLNKKIYNDHVKPFQFLGNKHDMVTNLFFLCGKLQLIFYHTKIK